MRRFVAIGFVALTTITTRAQGTTEFTVVPIELEGQNGNSGSELFALPTRYLQDWRGAYLAQQWLQPVRITGIAFRVENGHGSLDAVIPRIAIGLYNSQTAPENLRLFGNDTSNGRIVFDQSDVVLQSAGGPGPNPFNIQFQFSDAFYYDPRAAHLLVYIETFGPQGEIFPGGRFIDSQIFSGPINEVPATSAAQGRPTPGEFAFVGQFEWTAVPEPSSLTLLLGPVFWFLLAPGIYLRKG